MTKILNHINFNMTQYDIMGRRSFWYNLSKAEQEHISVDNIIEMLNAHNNAPFEQRGETIDTCYLFDHCYQDGTNIKWLYFSSGGGDWVTEEYFQNYFPNFFDELLRLGDFQELNDENSGWTNWKINNDYSDSLENIF